MRKFTKHPSQHKQVNSSTDTTRIPVPYNKYFEIDPPTRDADLLPGDRIEDYDCTFLAYLAPKPEYEDTLDMWPVLTDLTDYPVCDLVAGRLYPITPEDIHRHLGDMEYLVESSTSTKQFTKHPKKVTSSQDVDDYEDDIREISQEFTSENTSINSGKLPAIFKLIHLAPGTINIDYGGGKFDNVAEYLAPMDVINLVYDPYNRTPEHNREVIRTVKKAGGADSATCSNVLNVIKEPEVRRNVLENIRRLVKPEGVVYITVYEGSGRGNEGPTKSGYQLNRKTADYLAEIQEVFPDAMRKGKLIIAHPNGSAVTSAEDLSYDALTSEDYIFDLWTLVQDESGEWVRDDKIDTYDDYATARHEASALAKDTPCQLVEVGPDGPLVAWTSRLPEKRLPSRYWEPEDDRTDEEKYQDYDLEYNDEAGVESATAINAGRLVDPPQEVVDSLIRILDQYGFTLDPAFETNPGKTWMGAVHLQVINETSHVPAGDFTALRDNVPKALIDAIHDLEDSSNCPITWSFGVNKDGQVTAGLDIREQYVEDAETIMSASSISKKAIHDKLLNAASQRMQKSDMGFPLSEIADYLIVEEEETEDGALKIEVRCELDYRGMQKLAEALDPIVARYDKNAYFDMVAPGIMEAFIFNKKVTADSMTPVKSSRFNFPELPLEPPDYDEPEEHSSIEYIIVDLDDDILVSKDTFEFQGTPEFESEEDDWVLDEYPNIQLDDAENVTEHVLDVIEPQIPAQPGVYRVRGRVKLAYDVLVYVSYESEGPDDGAYIANEDMTEIDFNYKESSIEKLEVGKD